MRSALGDQKLVLFRDVVVIEGGSGLHVFIGDSMW
jgi:hypothetical protein